MSVTESIADVLEEAASLVLGNLDETTRVRRHDMSHADFDEAVFLKTINSDRPAQWLSHAIGYYLSDCGYELRALALLLHESIVGGSLEVLVRAVVERVGRIMWLLDLPPEYEGATPTVETAKGPMIRAIRASFEALVSTQFHRRGISSMKAPKEEQDMMATLERSIRSDVQKWFAPLQPPMDPHDPDSLDPTASTWTIKGETYPNYVELAEWSVAGGKITASQAKGIYATLSAWCHPNFIAGTRIRAADHTYVYDFESLQWLLSQALYGYLYALKAWSGYYDFNADEIAEHCDRIVRNWTAITPPQDESNAG
ncbi:MAG: hypothetical protein JWO62_1491 [Acidimicrobiaceae bacterium]|nr:hypothetical protein [Acidimicrobiaceae bacterium]